MEEKKRGSWFEDSNFRLPVVDNVGNILDEMPKNVELRIIRRANYYVVLKNGEIEEVKPALDFIFNDMLQLQ